jgi:hypothetical protein
MLEIHQQHVVLLGFRHLAVLYKQLGDVVLVSLAGFYERDVGFLRVQSQIILEEEVDDFYIPLVAGLIEEIQVGHHFKPYSSIKKLSNIVLPIVLDVLLKPQKACRGIYINAIFFNKK